MDAEPLIHSHLSDRLPETHPLARKTILCDICKEQVHAFNNECMQTWLETKNGNFCVKCFPITEVLDYLPNPKDPEK